MGLADSPVTWLLALGKTMVHSLWIGFLILVLLQLVLNQIPVLYSGRRYRVSLSALILLFCSVIVTFLVVHEHVARPADTSLFLDMFPVPGSLISDRQGAAAIRFQSLFSYFGYLYLAGLLGMIFRSLIALGYVSRLRTSGSPVDPGWQEQFRQLCLSMNIQGPVQILQSTLVKGPLLLGYLKPAIVLPLGMLSNLPASQIETILVHELYHLKRRDYLVNILQFFIEGLLFYHPAVWIISGIVRREREHCCDDGVLQEYPNPVDYAKALIHIAEQQHYVQLAPGALGPKKHHLKSRIYRILNKNTMKINLRDRVVSLALLAGSFLLVLAISGFSAGPSFFRSSTPNSQRFSKPLKPVEVFAVPDTIPQKMKEAEQAKALEEMEEARLELPEEIEEIDWEEIKEDMEKARLEALEAIDWEEIRAEMELTFSDMKMDMKEMKIEIEKSLQEIDWDQIKRDLEETMGKLETIRLELDHEDLDL